MMNSLAIYLDAGRKAGRARRQKDEALCQSLTSWLTRAKWLENEENRQAAVDAFHRGYREESGY